MNDIRNYTKSLSMQFPPIHWKSDSHREPTVFFREEKIKKNISKQFHEKERLLSYVSHEIRGFTNGIVGLTEILLSTSLTPQQREYLRNIKVSGDSMLLVMNDLLDFSKLEAGKMSFREVSFSLLNTIDAIIGTFLPRAIAKNIHLKKEMDPGLPAILIGDPYRLNQILTNLISNAIKFTCFGEVTLQVKIKKNETKAAMLEFVVKDTGKGIPKDKIHLLFNEFVQIHDDDATKHGGTGLGLMIVKQLTELQGGEIGVESKENAGTTFTVSLPFKKRDKITGTKDIITTTKKEKNLNPKELIGSKILLVEDNPLNQLLVEKLLRDVGVIVTLANSGYSAIEHLKNNTFDLVLMDIDLPGMNGYETTNYIRNRMNEQTKKIPIVALTGFVTIDEIEKCFNAEMNDYLSKPFDTFELYQKLIILLENQKEIDKLQLEKSKVNN